MLARRWGSDEDLMRDDDEYDKNSAKTARTREGVEETLMESATEREGYEMETLRRPEAVMRGLGGIVVETRWDVETNKM